MKSKANEKRKTRGLPAKVSEKIQTNNPAEPLKVVSNKAEIYSESTRIKPPYITKDANFWEVFMDSITTTAIFKRFGMDFKPETMFERFFFFTFSQYCTGDKPKITLTKDLIQVLLFALFSAVENYYGAMKKTFNFEKVKEDLPLSEFIKAVEMEMIKNILRGKDMDRTGANSRRLSTFFEECKRVEAQLKREGEASPSPKETTKRAILKIKKELPDYAKEISDLLPDSLLIKDDKFKYLYDKWYRHKRNKKK